MAELRCGVKNCTYNKESLCSKGDILVGGKQAKKEEDTCCESFALKREDKDVFTSAMLHGSPMISIDCKAVKCVYNSNYKCIAEHVDITGHGAGESKETACATFREK